MQRLSQRREDLVTSAVNQFFEHIEEKYRGLQAAFVTPQVKEGLNTVLIAENVLPKLNELKADGRMSEADSVEYLGLLRAKLAEGYLDWSAAVEKKEAAEKRRKRLECLHRQSRHSLEGISSVIESKGNEAADVYYDRIFEVLLREAAKEEIERWRDALCTLVGPDLQGAIAQSSKQSVYPARSDWGGGHETEKDILDLREVPIGDVNKLNGLVRWPVVKRFAEQSGLIPENIFLRVERIIIERLFHEQLFPGGRESWEGTAASYKIGALQNPEALPLLLKQIEAFGTGHTNDAVVYAMESLLSESNPDHLQQVLQSLPENKRILLETLANEHSYMTRFGRCNARYVTCVLLKDGDFTLAKEQLTRILENGGSFGDQQLKDFYLGSREFGPEASAELLQKREEVEQVIIQSKLSFWTQAADKLLAALVHPGNGDSVAFPKRIAKEGLGVSDEAMIGVLDQIFSTKTFKGSGFEREAFLDGLLVLNAKEDGAAVLETLLGVYRGAKNDPSRMRRIFQLLSTLDAFGEYAFVVPSSQHVDQIRSDIAGLEEQLPQTKEKSGRKKTKDAIETLKVELQNVTGLKGIEDAMTKKVVEVACRRLELPQKFHEKIEGNLEEFLRSGLFEIVPTLAGKYDKENRTDVSNLLRTVTEHIIEGDFNAWRYTHEQTAIQLAGLTEEQKKFWRETLEPITIDISLSDDEESRRADELRATKDILRNAKEHILVEQPHFDFSRDRARMLSIQVDGLTERIKSCTSDDEKRSLVVEKRRVQAETTLLSGFLEIEEATTASFTRDRICAQARALCNCLTTLTLPLAELDIQQIEKIFTVGDIRAISAYESDDPMTLLKVGVEPQETCQSWRNGGYNHCLLAYVADSNKKVLNVADGEGRIVARSMIKLTKQRDLHDFSSETERRTLLIEKPYSLLPNAEVYRAFIRVLLKKAQGLDASITFRGDGMDPQTLEIFEEEAATCGYGRREGTFELFIPQSLNRFEYSDALGGEITSFDRYQELPGVTFERLKTESGLLHGEE